MYFIDRVNAEKQRHLENIENIKKSLLNFPDGQIYHTFSHGHHSFKIYNNGKSETISIHDVEKLKQMAKKKLFCLRLEDEKILYEAADQYLNIINNASFKEGRYLTTHPEIADLISDSLSVNDDDFIKNWKEAPYESMAPLQENRMLKTIDGCLVRSRAEVTIINLLIANKIPYRYEDPVKVGNYIFYSDIHILHPKFYYDLYWEHMGLMTNPEYAENAKSKIIKYTQAGFIPGQNLILTFEDEHNTLDSEWIMNIIKHYFQ